LAEDYAEALTIAAAPAFIDLLRESDHPGAPDLQRLRGHAVQSLNQIRGELTLQEQLERQSSICSVDRKVLFLNHEAHEVHEVHEDFEYACLLWECVSPIWRVY
jgi:uncharacterized membrane protein YccC